MSHPNLHLHIISREDAKRLGFRRYFTGKPCNHGHITSRITCNRQCSECCRMRKLLRRNFSLMVPYVLDVEPLPVQLIPKSEAVKHGIKYYFNLIPCKKGHISPKLTSGERCFKCNKESMARYRDRNSERIKNYNNNYTLENKDRISEYQKEYEKRFPGRSVKKRNDALKANPELKDRRKEHAENTTRTIKIESSPTLLHIERDD